MRATLHKSCLPRSACILLLTASTWVQRSPDEAAEFCQRRVTHVRKQLDELGEEIQSKQNAMVQINQVMGQRSRAAQASEAAGQV